MLSIFLPIDISVVCDSYVTESTTVIPSELIKITDSPFALSFLLTWRTPCSWSSSHQIIKYPPAGIVVVEGSVFGIRYALSSSGVSVKGNRVV